MVVFDVAVYVGVVVLTLTLLKHHDGRLRTGGCSTLYAVPNASGCVGRPQKAWVQAVSRSV